MISPEYFFVNPFACFRDFFFFLLKAWFSFSNYKPTVRGPSWRSTHRLERQKRNPKDYSYLYFLINIGVFVYVVSNDKDN